MNALPFNLIPLSDTRKQFYRNWLRERRLDLELSAAAEKDVLDDVTDLDWEADVAPCDKLVRAGQIRLLDHEIIPDCVPGRYVAVLELNEELGTGLCVPFSRYSEPATKDEWRTPYESTPLKVMQFWNAHMIPTRELACHSWTILSIARGPLRTMHAIYQATLTGSWLPVELRDQTGIPIYTATDERLAYQQEERTLFSTCDELLDRYLDAIEKWRQPSRNIFEESRPWAKPEALAAGGARNKHRIRIELPDGQNWDGVAVQIDDFSEGDEFEIRWKIENPPDTMVPGIPVLICTPDRQLQTTTRAQGDLIVYRTNDEALWHQLKGRSTVFCVKMDPA